MAQAWRRQPVAALRRLSRSAPASSLAWRPLPCCPLPQWQGLPGMLRPALRPRRAGQEPPEAAESFRRARPAMPGPKRALRSVQGSAWLALPGAVLPQVSRQVSRLVSRPVCRAMSQPEWGLCGPPCRAPFRLRARPRNRRWRPSSPATWRAGCRLLRWVPMPAWGWRSTPVPVRLLRRLRQPWPQQPVHWPVPKVVGVP